MFLQALFKRRGCAFLNSFENAQACCESKQDNLVVTEMAHDWVRHYCPQRIAESSQKAATNAKFAEDADHSEQQQQRSQGVKMNSALNEEKGRITSVLVARTVPPAACAANVSGVGTGRLPGQ